MHVLIGALPTLREPLATLDHGLVATVQGARADERSTPPARFSTRNLYPMICDHSGSKITARKPVFDLNFCILWCRIGCGTFPLSVGRRILICEAAMSAPARKESILDLKLLVEKRIHVKLAGGREGNDHFCTYARSSEHSLCWNLPTVTITCS